MIFHGEDQIESIDHLGLKGLCLVSGDVQPAPGHGVDRELGDSRLGLGTGGLDVRFNPSVRKGLLCQRLSHRRPTRVP